MTQIPSRGSTLTDRTTELRPDIDLTGSSESATDTAKEQAAQVAQTAAGKTQEIAGTAKVQAGAVVAETGRQASDLLRQATQELTSQASAQQERLASSLRALGDELGAMADHEGERGVASDLARQASAAIRDAAGWFDGREPGQLLSEVRTFAQRRPGAFLALALGAGLAAGRLTRAEASALKEQHEGSSSNAGSLSSRADVSPPDPMQQTLPTSGGPGDLASAPPHPSAGTGLGDPLGGVR